VSRAVRIPTRFEADLRLGLPGSPPLLLGNPDFEAENALSAEVGYRLRPHRAVALDLATYVTRYSDLRSIERLGEGPFPVRWDNLLDGRVAGGEIVVQIQPVSRARFDVVYSYLTKSLRLEPESTDPTGGSVEGNDPRHQGLFRWSVDLAPRWQLDGAVRAVSALPNPRVPAYADANLRLAWQTTPHLELSLIGRDLIGGRHAEFGPEESRVQIERSVSGRAIVRF
jgi:iron complex outermembrane receptor protein